MRKVRNKVVGTIGDAILSYDRYETLSYFCIPDSNEKSVFMELKFSLTIIEQDYWRVQRC